jgi:hypothetical protein
VDYPVKAVELIKKEPRFSTGLFSWFGLENYYFGSLQTLGAFFDGELHLLAFLKVLEAVSLDG